MQLTEFQPNRQSDAERVDWQMPLSVVAIVFTGLGGFMTALSVQPWIWIIFTVYFLLVTISAVLQTEASWRTRVYLTLKSPTFASTYRWMVVRPHSRVWRRFGRSINSNAPLYKQIYTVSSWRLYDFSLYMAFVYPILLLTSYWFLTGKLSGLGYIAILPPVDFFPIRAATGAFFIAVALASAIPIVFRINLGWSGVTLYRFFGVALLLNEYIRFTAGAEDQRYGIIFIVYFLGVIVTLRSGVSTSIFSMSFGCLTALFISKYNTEAVSVYWSVGVFILPVVISTAASLLISYNMERKASSYIPKIIFSTSVSVVAISYVLIDWTHVTPNDRLLLMFFTFIPFLNAIFDFISYIITLSFMRKGFRSPSLAIIWAIFDLLTAFILFHALGALLLTSLFLMEYASGCSFINTQTFFERITIDPFDHIWLFLMLFSTLLPTCIHVGLSIMGLQNLVPRRIKYAAMYALDRAPNDKVTASIAPFLIGLVWAIPLAFAAISLTLLWATTGDFIKTMIDFYHIRMVYISNFLEQLF